MQDDLNSYPSSWVPVTLGDITEAIQCIDPKEEPNREFIYLDISSIDNQRQEIRNPKRYLGKEAPSRARQLVKKGDIIFSTVRTYLKNLALVGEKYDNQIASTGFCVIRPHKEVCEKFIFYLIQTESFLRPLNQIQRGSSYPAVRTSDVLTQEIWLPPYAEQHRIVAKIEELFSRLDAGIETLRKVQNLLERYRLSVLRAAFNGSLTAEWRKITNKNQGNVIITQGPYLEELVADDLPPGWFYIALGELGELNRGKSKHRPRNDPRLFGGKYPFIQTGDISNARDVICEYTQTYNDFGLEQSRLWPANTLCITIAANIARTAILGFPACFPDSVVGFVADEDKVNVWYVYYYMQSIQSRLEKLAPATAQKNINLEILSHVPIPYCHLDEQAAVVSEIERRLAIADMLKETITGSMAKSSMMRQSLLHRAFTGQLVPQDPSDEPASKLLERIKAERARMEADQPRRRKRRAN